MTNTSPAHKAAIKTTAPTMRAPTPRNSKLDRERDQKIIDPNLSSLQARYSASAKSTPAIKYSDDGHKPGRKQLTLSLANDCKVIEPKFWGMGADINIYIYAKMIHCYILNSNPRQKTKRYTLIAGTKDQHVNSTQTHKDTDDNVSGRAIWAPHAADSMALRPNERFSVVGSRAPLDRSAHLGRCLAGQNTGPGTRILRCSVP